MEDSSIFDCKIPNKRKTQHFYFSKYSKLMLSNEHYSHLKVTDTILKMRREEATRKIKQCREKVRGVDYIKRE